LFNPLSTNARYTPHESDVTCSRCGASRTAKSLKKASVLIERGENLLQNGILHFAIRFS